MLYRPPRSQAELGCTRTQFYEGIARGLITRQIKISERAAAHPDYEIEAIKKARIAGLSETEIRKLVDRLHAQRVELATELRAAVAQ